MKNQEKQINILRSEASRLGYHGLPLDTFLRKAGGDFALQLNSNIDELNRQGVSKSERYKDLEKRKNRIMKKIASFKVGWHDIASIIAMIISVAGLSLLWQNLIWGNMVYQGWIAFGFVITCVTTGALINEYAKDKVEKISTKGSTLNEDGEKIGENDGFINYTVGQRKGIGLTNPEPLYVKEISSDKNSIIVSEKKSLFSKKCKISNINWLKNKIKFPLDAFAQIRYNGQISEAKISDKKGSIFATFNKPQLAITPGQSIVFYDKKETLLGGGIIELHES